MSLEERIRQSVGHALDEVRARVEAEVRAIAQELVASAAEEQQAAVANARDVATAEARQEIDREIAEAEVRARAGVDDRVFEARTDEREQVTRELHERLTAEADARVRAVTEEGEARLRAALEDADARVTRAVDEAVAAARERADAERASGTATVSAQFQGLRSELERHRREAEASEISRLLDAVRVLDSATSLSDVLDALGQGAAHEAGRAALVVVRGDRVQAWKLAGFGARDAEPRSIDIAIGEAGIIGTTVSTAQVVSTATPDTPGAPAFAELPADRLGIAVPVVVGGRVVAVVYADTAADVDLPAGADQANTLHAGWVEVIEMLARHAGRCLEALTAQRTSQQPSPRVWAAPAAPKPAVPA